MAVSASTEDTVSVSQLIVNDADYDVHSALYWSLGASLIEESRIKFDNYAKRLASMPTIPDDSMLAGPGRTHHYTMGQNQVIWRH